MSGPIREDEDQVANVMASSSRFLSRAFGVGFLFSFIVFLILALAVYLTFDKVTGEGKPGEPVDFEVPQGATGRDVARLLDEARLVRYAWHFRLAMRLDDSIEPIKHGVHALPRGLSAAQLLALLRETPPPQVDPDAVKVTIPEGLSIAQMAELFDDSAAFDEAVARIDPAEFLQFDVPGLEGFLMPNTYYFSEQPDPKTLIEQMLAQFQADYSRLLEAYPDRPERDPVRLTIVASLVEEEARVDEERPIIAAVIYNRLKHGRALQMDSTLQYALGKYGERLLNEDKAVDSPYNTYKRRGLPPGPISNPGVASLRAAMAPADADYLYFVSNADGKTHTFSRTLKEHEAAVAKYRREIRQQRRKERLNQAEH